MFPLPTSLHLVSHHRQQSTQFSLTQSSHTRTQHVSSMSSRNDNNPSILNFLHSKNRKTGEDTHGSLALPPSWEGGRQSRWVQTSPSASAIEKPHKNASSHLANNTTTFYKKGFYGLHPHRSRRSGDDRAHTHRREDLLYLPPIFPGGFV